MILSGIVQVGGVGINYQLNQCVTGDKILAADYTKQKKPFTSWLIPYRTGVAKIKN